MKKLLLLPLGLVFLYTFVQAQTTLYVDVLKGNDSASGEKGSPLASLQKAVAIANQATGAVTIKLGPGYYLLTDVVRIESLSGDTARYTVEATVLPDDKDWNPGMMPVIGSISRDNDKKYFDHCAGIMAERANVSIRGLKFIGNPNPAVYYYYPIIRDTLTLRNLDIAQCYFIGDRNGAVMQGAIYAEGPGIHVDHCVFYGCKNDVLVFFNLDDFSITHTILYGAYEGAVWYGFTEPDKPYIFTNNIVTHCNYVWSSSKDIDHSSYVFSHSLITENDHYVGMQNGQGGVMPLPKMLTFRETDIRKSGTVKLSEVTIDGFPPDWLNLTKDSDGRDLDAGIFMGKKN